MIYMQNKQKQRYYSLNVEQDLFDTWCLVKIFGSLNSRRGRIIRQICDNEQDAWEKLTEIEYAKRQRGYSYADLENRKIESNIVLKSSDTSDKIKLSKMFLNTNQLELWF